MALLTVEQAKAYLRIETTAEDDLLKALLASATATVRTYLDRPIEAQSRTYTIEDRRASSLDLQRLAIGIRPATFLMIPDAPVDLTQTLTITDADGTTLVVGSDVRVDAATGVVRGYNGLTFGRFPYTVVATTGLATRSDYGTAVEPALNAAIGDVFADLVQRRNPAATGESAAGGDSTHYGRQEETIPLRALDLLKPFRRVVL